MDDTPRVELEVVSYSLVAAQRTDSQYRVECIHAGGLDEAMRRRFTSYVLRCYQAREVGFQEIVFRTEQGHSLNAKLTRLLKVPVGEGDAERCDITQELAANLSEFMQSGGRPGAPGALFVIQARFDGDRHIALIKVDLERQEIVALQQATEARHLFSKVFQETLPKDPKKIRKALLVPSPGQGDARTSQFDAYSDYWQEFVGARPLRETVKATKAVLATAKEVLQQEGGVLTEAMGWTILQRVGDLKSRTPHSVAAIIKEVTRVQKKGEKIEQALQRHLGQATLGATTQVSAYVYRFLDDELKLKVPAQLLRDGKVSVKNEGNDIVIRIRGSDVDRDDVVDNRP